MAPDAILDADHLMGVFLIPQETCMQHLQEYILGKFVDTSVSYGSH